MGDWKTTMTDEEKILMIYEELFKYIGFNAGSDVEYEFDNDILWKIQNQFSFTRKKEFIPNRLDYFLKTTGKHSKLKQENPVTMYYYDTKFYKRKISSFRISHQFSINEIEERLYCESEITFYFPKNSRVTGSISVFCRFSCNLSKRFNYTKKENLELDKWLLRKASFLRFLEVVDQCKKDRSWVHDKYIDTYWIYIYSHRQRNKIRLG